MIDTHAHLFLCEGKIPDLIRRAKSAGVTDIINVSLDLETAKTTAKIHQGFPTVHPTAGYYPSCVEKEYDIAALEQLLNTDTAFKAVGEIGLDYFYDYGDRKKQECLFRSQIELALKHDLPIIIHNRDAEEDMIHILADYPSIHGVLHCFSSDTHFLESILNICPNILFSFTGMITFAKKGKSIRAIKSLPLEKIMIETDCPYLTPKEEKGKKNEPAFVGFVTAKIASVKDLTLSQVDEVTTSNARRLFNL